MNECETTLFDIFRLSSELNSVQDLDMILEKILYETRKITSSLKI